MEKSPDAWEKEGRVYSLRDKMRRRLGGKEERESLSLDCNDLDD